MLIFIEMMSTCSVNGKGVIRHLTDPKSATSIASLATWANLVLVAPLVRSTGSGRCSCPDCLFEGPHFDDLMAHISRRHPDATPDDFVPGLIHHRPLRLPRSVSDLPPLPSRARITGEFMDDLCGEVKGFAGERSYKARRSVERNCFSGRRPRKDDFADKKGANAAISAFIENSRRISTAMGGQQESPAEADAADVPPTAKSAPLTAAEAKEMGVDLVDVSQSISAATEQAKREAEKDEAQTTGSDSRSSSTSRADIEPVKRKRGRPPKLHVTLKLSESPAERFSLESPPSTSSESSSGSETASEFKLKRALDLTALVSPDGGESGRKRSARLREKQGLGTFDEEIKV
ncbi:hypothetical protein BD324DRAFT_629804 [Kockovaella imperatae]|uniref:C2H2-type domain-containing protein n=1 Tax=Kockovaella imperatae TaxID=4999 RepID=A0A1Y1UD64_9TREE|nr:hypothetical protein BD324DRAFT_629804 [Kockovaella imperatae]ORX35998.1 hypothetical protein BD324DRAFT_629804 [Kockovaella imperatae]